MRWTAFFLLVMDLTLLSACSTTPATSTPSLSDFDARTLPTGGSDAALAAHTTY